MPHIFNSHEGVVVKQFAKWKTEHNSASTDHRRLQSPSFSREISCETLEDHNWYSMFNISLSLPTWPDYF